jgi:hypothetical protein
MSTPEETKETTINSTTPAADNAWRERRNADKIPCPALLSFYNNGSLNPDEDGNVTTAHLEEVLASVGVSNKVRKALVKGADKTDEIPDSFNLFALRDSSLDHSGSTGIRDPDVNSEKLDNALLKFNENGRMYAEHFAAAANQAQEQDPGIKGTIIQTAEFTALLEVFGRIDESNKRYLTVDDVKGLWIDGKYPKDWQPRAADDIDVSDVTAGVAEITVKRLLSILGF